MKYNEFFGSKLNTVLLLILIVLMIVAIKIMWLSQNAYLPFLDDKQAETSMPAISGNKDDLVSFSILSGQKVSGKIEATGAVKGGYFFEGNIVVNILDGNKKLLKKGNGMATTDWMTANPVTFKITLDFTGLPKGSAFIEIHNDNPSDIRANDKSILIPITIE